MRKSEYFGALRPPSDEQSRQGARLDGCRHRSGRSNSMRGEGEPVLPVVSAHEEGKNGPRAEPPILRRHGSVKGLAGGGSASKPHLPCVRRDLNLIKRRAD